MNQRKYIIVEQSCLLAPILFPLFMTHKKMSHGFKVVSAGFVTWDANGKVTAYGRSESLNIGSRPEDAEIIEIGNGDKEEESDLTILVDSNYIAP